LKKEASEKDAEKVKENIKIDEISDLQDLVCPDNPESELADEETENKIDCSFRIIGVNKVNVEIGRNTNVGIFCRVKIQQTGYVEIASWKMEFSVLGDSFTTLSYSGGSFVAKI
jgi:hypothetical protein